jgi:uncharacterized SAM-binding protein YcdF (DUF218 family)
MLSHLIRELLLPPSSMLLLLAVCFVGKGRYPRASKALAGGVVAVFYLFSIPLVSYHLTRATESLPAATPEQIAQFGPQAIVVLGGGALVGAAEYDGATVPARATWPRVGYAAYLARQTGLPVLACGGTGAVVEQSEGYAMATVLRDSGVAQVWVEGRSRDTWENARFGKEQLVSRGIDRVLLVTNAQHARRAQSSFQATGLTVLSAPTEFRQWGAWERGVLLVVPTHHSSDESCYALRVLMGELWYSLRS